MTRKKENKNQKKQSLKKRKQWPISIFLHVLLAFILCAGQGYCFVWTCERISENVEQLEHGLIVKLSSIRFACVHAQRMYHAHQIIHSPGLKPDKTRSTIGIRKRKIMVGTQGKSRTRRQIDFDTTKSLLLFIRPTDRSTVSLSSQRY